MSRWWEPWPVRLSLALAAAVAVGLLEAFWTGPGRDAPTNTWGGIVAILVILLIVTALLERPWWIPALAIVEEATHGFAGYPGWVPTWATIFAHWSHQYVGFPLMPWITFLLITLAAEMYFHRPLPSKSSNRD